MESASAAIAMAAVSNRPGVREHTNETGLAPACDLDIASVADAGFESGRRFIEAVVEVEIKGKRGPA